MSVARRSAEYEVPFSYPGSIDPFTYAGTRLLVPCRVIRVARDLVLPKDLVGKRVRVRVVVEEDRA